jgi:hypothetical protein
MFQNFISLLIGGLSMLFVYLIFHGQSWWQFALLVVLWIALLAVAAINLKEDLEKKFVTLPLLIFTVLGLAGLALVVEWEVVRFVLILATGVLLSALFSKTSAWQTGLSHELKPLRRMVMMLWVFNLYALSVFIFAFGIFLDVMPLWLSSLALAVIYGLVSIEIWKLYFAIPGRRFALWSLVVGLIFWEIIYIFFLLPLGYFVSSLLIVWVWYLMHLLVRFHLGVQGIVWRKQVGFLIANVILFLIALLLFARWI